MAGKKLTKAGLVESAWLKTGVDRQEIQAVLEHFLSDIKKALAKGSRIELRGFGTFEVRFRKARSRARNPRTGELIPVQAHGIAAFRPGRELKAAVWEAVADSAAGVLAEPSGGIGEDAGENSGPEADDTGIV
jgi:integration host factor subunit beta